MSAEKKENALGSLLLELLHTRALSIRKCSERTGIDKATISRIINGKRKANLQHLEKFADCLDVPIMKLMRVAGYPTQQSQEKYDSDLLSSVDNIQNILKSSELYDDNFSLELIQEQLATYEQRAQTNEGKQTIYARFEEKLEKAGGIGPFINQLKDLYHRFVKSKGTASELAIVGGVLLYFIIPIDVIPDYIFPIGYVDDAIAVQIAVKSLSN